jgi:hypothetical protein
MEVIGDVRDGCYDNGSIKKDEEEYQGYGGCDVEKLEAVGPFRLQGLALGYIAFLGGLFALFRRLK